MNETAHNVESSGFTLIETVIFVAIFSILTLALFNIFAVYGTLYTADKLQFTTVNDTRTPLNELAATVAQAHRVMNSQTINGTDYQTNTTTLVVQLPSITLDGSIVENTWDYAVFFTSSTNLYRLSAPNAASARPAGQKILGDSIVSIVFTFDSADFSLVHKVSVNIESQSQSNHVTVTNTSADQIILKNY